MPLNHHFNQFEEKEIIKHYNHYKNLKKTAIDFNTSINTIKNILNVNNIYSGNRKRNLNIEYFKSIDSPEKAYWLGFIVADGCITKNGYKLTFGVKDDDILSKFKNSIQSDSPVSFFKIYDKRTNRTYGRYSLQICSKEFCSYIRKLGIDENKSKSFKFPNICPELYSHFIRGMFDGDGSIFIKKSKVKKNMRFGVNIISTFDGVEFMKQYLESINIVSNKIVSNKDQNIHYIIFHKGAIDFLEWIYKDSTDETRLNRKYHTYMDNLDAILNTPRQYTIKNHIINKSYNTTNLVKFCKKHNLNDTYLRHIRKTGNIPSKGKHLGWELLPF